jgi:hypothetical protein
MSFRLLSFNTYLLLGAIFWMVGCKSAEQRKRDQLTTTFWLHLEAAASQRDTNRVLAVSIAGVDFLADKAPFLTEQDVDSAAVVETTDGGFAIRVRYNDHGKLVLDMVTSSNRGRHMVIYANYGIKKQTKTVWLAAPLIVRRVDDGVIVFTPSVARPEAEEIIKGLQHAAEEAKKPWVF